MLPWSRRGEASKYEAARGSGSLEPGGLGLTLYQEFCVRPGSGLEALCGYFFVCTLRGGATSTLPGYCVD